MSEPGNADALPDQRVLLTDHDLVLRPMREDDLPQALEWDNEPEVHYFMQGDTTPLFTLEDLRDMYRGVAQAAYVFVTELAGRDIGTCWLQDMNVERLKECFPGRTLKRIDLSIGVKDLWGQGHRHACHPPAHAVWAGPAVRGRDLRRPDLRHQPQKPGRLPESGLPAVRGVADELAG